MNDRQLQNAKQARQQGIWDNPDLMTSRPLSGDVEADLERIESLRESKAVFKTRLQQAVSMIEDLLNHWPVDEFCVDNPVQWVAETKALVATNDDAATAHQANDAGRQSGKTGAASPEQVTPHAIIYVRGGIVQGADTNTAIDLTVIDYDVAPDESCETIDGPPAWAYGMGAASRTPDYAKYKSQLDRGDAEHS